MNKIIFVLFVSMMCLSCSTKEKLILNPKVKETKTSNTFEFIPNGALIKSYSIIDKNIEYTVGISSNNRILYIMTIDENFTIYGLKVNDRLPESYFNQKLGYSAGWGYYIEIDSGWYAGFDFQTKPTIESKIQWFFQYDFSN